MGDQRAKPAREALGFTLVELMMVVAIIGILAAIALPAFSKYVKKSRTAEATLVLGKMWMGAVAYYEADHADSATIVVPKQFPGDSSSSGMVCSWPPPTCSTRTRCPVSNFSILTTDNYPWVRTN